MKGIDMQVLKLSELDPKKDIIIINVYVGLMKPSKAKEYLNNIKTEINPLFEERGFRSIYVPVVKATGNVEPVKSSEIVTDQIKNIMEDVSVDSYKEAMKAIS